MADERAVLLAADEPVSWQLEQGSGRSCYVLICDHAGNQVPAALAGLGLADSELQRHIAWDIGAAEVARHLAELLDATLILQRYSRLVIDCNRPPGSPESVVAVSDGVAIPGNQQLGAEALGLREREIFRPYHAAIAAHLDGCCQQGQVPVPIFLHSFTPSFQGQQRPWHIGTLYNRDARLAQRLMASLRQQESLSVGDNQPYSAGDDTDYSIPQHGERRGLMHVGLELRQDLIADAAGQRHWSMLLARHLQAVAPNDALSFPR